MNPPTEADAIAVAGKLARRLWSGHWQVLLRRGLGDLADVEQVAWLAVQRRLPLYDPTHPSGASLETFVWNYLRMFVLRWAQHSLLIRIPAQYHYEAGRAKACQTASGRELARRAYPLLAQGPLPVKSLTAPAAADLADAEPVLAAIARLHPRYRQILLDRFGLAGDPERTLEEIGQARGVSRERARQLVSRALAKLRAALGLAAAGEKKIFPP